MATLGSYIACFVTMLEAPGPGGSALREYSLVDARMLEMLPPNEDWAAVRCREDDVHEEALIRQGAVRHQITRTDLGKQLIDPRVGFQPHPVPRGTAVMTFRRVPTKLPPETKPPAPPLADLLRVMRGD